jgi:hypothetical protein
MQAITDLPATVSREIFATLRGLLPPPATDTPEARADREETAMAAVIALYPADAFEADLAAQIVGADAHAKDSLRLAVVAGTDTAEARRCRAQAISMMRQMQSGLRTLQRMQAAKEKAEAAMQPAAMERAGYWFRDVSVPAPVAPPEAAAAPEYADLPEAEQYAIIYPDRAIRICAERGLPKRLDFGPPEPAIVDAIVNGTSPIMRALDQRQHAAAMA